MFLASWQHLEPYPKAQLPRGFVPSPGGVYQLHSHLTWPWHRLVFASSLQQPCCSGQKAEGRKATWSDPTSGRAGEQELFQEELDSSPG